MERRVENIYYVENDCYYEKKKKEKWRIGVFFNWYY